MLKISENQIKELEARYTGYRDTLMHFENATLPTCSHCGSDNTASVQCGIIGRTINLAAGTTKFRLIPNGPKPGQFFCNDCGNYFDAAD